MLSRSSFIAAFSSIVSVPPVVNAGTASTILAAWANARPAGIPVAMAVAKAELQKVRLFIIKRPARMF